MSNQEDEKVSTEKDSYQKMIESYQKYIDTMLDTNKSEKIFATALKTLPQDILAYSFQDWNMMITRSITFATQFVNTFDLSQGRE